MKFKTLIEKLTGIKGAKFTFTESRTHLGGTTQRTYAEMHDLDGMVIETNDNCFDFKQFFYNHLPTITGEESLLVYSYQLTPEQKKGCKQRFIVNVRYSPLKKRGIDQVFELKGEEREKHFNLIVQSLTTSRGTTYSVGIEK